MSTFFKLTNQAELHRRVLFKDGLIIDTETFDETEMCRAGGIHFCREEDIHRWLYYDDDIGLMTWMRSVTIPSDARVYHDQQTYKSKADRLILGPRQRIPTKYYVKSMSRGVNAWFVALLLKVDDLQTPEVCMEAVKHSGDALVYVKNQTPEIV